MKVLLGRFVLDYMWYIKRMYLQERNCISENDRSMSLLLYKYIHTIKLNLTMKISQYIFWKITSYKKRMECSEGDWSIECSDDEKYEIDDKVK